MFKEPVLISGTIYYSPLHNMFTQNPPDEDESKRLEKPVEIRGKQKKIFEFLLSKPWEQISSEELQNAFPECSDPYNKALEILMREKMEKKLHLYEVIKKEHGHVTLYLIESPFADDDAAQNQNVPLLLRDHYSVDHETILTDCMPAAEGGTGSRQSILRKWIDECAALKNFDEKSLMLLERIGFLPVFGKKEDKKYFLSEAKKLIFRYSTEDIRQYGSSTEMLQLARDILYCVIEYIEAQLDILLPEENGVPQPQVFVQMLKRFRAVQIPKDTPVNPLLLTVFYQYYGLVCYRNHLGTPSQEFLKEAVRLTELALENARRTDRHLQVWTAFLTYNLGRYYSALQMHDKAIQNIYISVVRRQTLAESPFFSEELKRKLCFEYLLARIVQTDIERAAGKLSDAEAQAELAAIQADAEKNYSAGDSGDSQLYIRRLLQDRMQ